MNDSAQKNSGRSFTLNINDISIKDLMLMFLKRSRSVYQIPAQRPPGFWT